MTELAYHGNGFIEATHKGVRVFVDPVFSQTRRGRRARAETRPCDFLLVSHVGDAFEDALDLLEDQDSATLVGSMDACRTARRELRIDRERTLDLEEWERATDGDVRITALPITLPTPASAGLGWAQNVGEAVEAEFSRMLARSPLAALPTRGMRALARMPLGRGFGGAPTVGEAALGFSLELGDATVVLLGQGVHDATDERDLEDIADLGAIDTLALEATGSVGAVVRAVRVLEPKRVCVYRAHDPYGRGRRALALAGGGMPLSAYIDAISEDQSGRVEARALKPGDTIALRANGTPAKAEAAKPTA